MDFLTPEFIVSAGLNIIQLMTIIMVFTKPENFWPSFGQVKEVYITPNGTVAVQEYKALQARLMQYMSVPDWRSVMDAKYKTRKYIEIGLVNNSYHDVVAFGGGLDVDEARDIASRLIKALKINLDVAPAITLHGSINQQTEFKQVTLGNGSAIIQALAVHSDNGAYKAYLRIYFTEDPIEIPMANQLLQQSFYDGTFQFNDSQEPLYTNMLIDTLVESNHVPAASAWGNEQSFMQAPYRNYQEPAFNPTPANNWNPQFAPTPVQGNGTYGNGFPQQQGNYQQPMQQPFVQPITPLRPVGPYNPNVSYGK